MLIIKQTFNQPAGGHYSYNTQQFRCNYMVSSLAFDLVILRFITLLLAQTSCEFLI